MKLKSNSLLVKFAKLGSNEQNPDNPTSTCDLISLTVSAMFRVLSIVLLGLLALSPISLLFLGSIGCC